MESEINQSCKEHFGKIEERLDKGDMESREQGEKLVELKTDLNSCGVPITEDEADTLIRAAYQTIVKTLLSHSA
jgi:hypothetical protein